MKSKPNYKPTIIAFLLKTKLHPISTSLSRLLILKWSASCGCASRPVVKATSFLCMCVKASDKGACVYTCMHNSFLLPATSLRLMVRNARQGGNLFWCFKAQGKKKKKRKRLLCVCVSVTHWNRCQKQYSHHLEGAVGRVDEPKLSNVASWDVVDCWTTVASLHQADGLRWEREEEMGLSYTFPVKHASRNAIKQIRWRRWAHVETARHILLNRSNYSDYDNQIIWK